MRVPGATAAKQPDAMVGAMNGVTLASSLVTACLIGLFAYVDLRSAAPGDDDEDLRIFPQCRNPARQAFGRAEQEPVQPVETPAEPRP
jgi:hypothetical protein